ncbi:MAG TPA: hypothetical protein VNJ08_09485 [Bacteriovoracaceae bacterium]|nr:hypothetical protein [Bacteriovoracaceae bacterium]
MISRIALFLLFLGGCSLFIQEIETPLVRKTDYLKLIPEVPSFCPIEQKVSIQLIGSNGNSQAVYMDMIAKLGTRLDLFDHLALWSLAQLSIRPDQSTPTSRLQVLFHLKDKTHYFDFFSESNDDQYPYLYGIEWILKRFNKTQRLEHYARLLRDSLGEKLRIGKDFENFLLKNQDKIKANAELAPYFFRGSEVLKENETSPPLDFVQVIKQYRKAEKNQKIIVNTSLIQFMTEKGNAGGCNYDFNLYNNSIFLIDKIIPVANLFGLSFPAGSFMASSSQKLERAEAFHGLPLFKGESKVRSSAVCVIEEGDNKIWTFSNQSRDPGQHLFHLVRYGLPRSQSTPDVDRLLRHSRHLFLSDPVRLIIESQRSREDQIENLLKLNLPIYNAEKLGNIWAYTHFNDQGRFIIDDRNPGSFACR